MSFRCFHRLALVFPNAGFVIEGYVDPREPLLDEGPSGDHSHLGRRAACHRDRCLRRRVGLTKNLGSGELFPPYASRPTLVKLRAILGASRRVSFGTILAICAPRDDRHASVA